MNKHRTHRNLQGTHCHKDGDDERYGRDNQADVSVVVCPLREVSDTVAPCVDCNVRIHVNVEIYYMNPTAMLKDSGQSLWLDNITRDLLDNGTLQKYRDTFSVTGLTSNPTIFNHAIKNSSSYDKDILEGIHAGKGEEEVFFSLALADIVRASELFDEIHHNTDGVDGWASLEVPPSLAYDVEGTIQAAKDLHRRANRGNVYIKIPGTAEGLRTIEESIFAGIPINVTLLFSSNQYLAAAEAYARGVERRISAGLNPNVASVASVFISRWDVATHGKAAEPLQGRLGVAIAQLVYREYQQVLRSPRWQRLYNSGARSQRLLWASTGTKDPNFPDTFYVEALRAPFTINTMPDATLNAFASHGRVQKTMLTDEMDADRMIKEFVSIGIDVDALGARLQKEGASAFSQSWDELMEIISHKAATLTGANQPTIK
jgi:transaldolase